MDLNIDVSLCPINMRIIIAELSLLMDHSGYTLYFNDHNKIHV